MKGASQPRNNNDFLGKYSLTAECLGTSLLFPLPQNLFGRTHSVCAYGQSRDCWYSARTYSWHRNYLNLYPY